MTDDDRAKFQLQKLQELQGQMETLETGEFTAAEQAGLQDNINGRLRDLQVMGVLSVAERNEFDLRIREIVKSRTSTHEGEKVAVDLPPVVGDPEPEYDY